MLVATPGRLLDLFRQNALKFNQLQTLVLDEADRMLDLGFPKNWRTSTACCRKSARRAVLRDLLR
jgi:superfamily II DNA/RNA helicase